ncbi:UDP-N-acetylmuramoyl-tripeptide--D-alanyl-D-alanine ligase [Novosphingobium sp.]|uniref:UDP-N-acetylmuramoyl-tripeptide--D-alanyl-D- alanine ligase n=1 Tax=Novosphingobium sp. TaxID=1874826 RepID=UPI0025D1E1DC|nr:UDP-N-acetylmuramoyl-tripeptide--D-alanyl-D-alanine ligase [Novosphingobium sp.]
MNAFARILEWPIQPDDSAGLALWTAGEIAAATGGTPSADFQAAGADIDSRDVAEGDLFFALKGEAMDGHVFVDAAFAKGAAAAIVEQPIAAPHVLVSNTSSALEDMAKVARNRADARIIGVTGSVGKTGVKEAIFAALDRSSRGRAHRSVKSYNNHVGVPLSLTRMSARAKFGVFEMGMNHAGEIRALAALVRPHVAVITTIAPAHIEMLGSEEAIADAKAEIFEGLEPGGVAIIPADSPHHARLKEAAEKNAGAVVSFGRAAHADVRLLDAVPAPGGGSLVTADMGDRRICYTVAAPGDHWIINSLAVIAAVRAAGGDLGAAGLALAELEGLKGRGERSTIAAQGGDGSGSALIIDESYNANPASMRATLAQLGSTPARRRIAVLGAMKELGGHAAAFHAQLIEPVAAAGIDQLILVGDEMQALADELGKEPPAALGKAIPFAHCKTASEALAALTRFGVQGGDAVLIKGSNSVGLGTMVAALTQQEG